MSVYFVVAVFGAVIGSFLNVCIYRMPRNLSVVFPPSKCTNCGAQIRAWDNIPIISYALLRGKCRNCKSGISARYPLVEALNACLYAAVLWRYGFTWNAAVYCLLVSTLVVITFIDLDFQIIPDRITLPGIPLGIVSGSLLLPDPFLRSAPLGLQASLIGAGSGFLVYYLIAVLGEKVFRKEAMGGGDIKMMAMLGGFMGWKSIILTTFLGSLLGSVIGIFLIAVKGRKQGAQIPFGPFLALGAVISLFFGQEILTWYLY